MNQNAIKVQQYNFQVEKIKKHTYIIALHSKPAKSLSCENVTASLETSKTVYKLSKSVKNNVLKNICKA